MPLAGQTPDFPKFFFAGHDAEAELLSRYLWHHFSTRVGHGNTLFNQECLTTSDTWMAGALHPGWPFPMWTNAPSGARGYTAGWHFQNDGTGRVWEHFLRRRPDSRFGRAKAVEGWELEHVRSLGIRDNKWQLEATGEAHHDTQYLEAHRRSAESANRHPQLESHGNWC